MACATGLVIVERAMAEAAAIVASLAERMSGMVVLIFFMASLQSFVPTGQCGGELVCRAPAFSLADDLAQAVGIAARCPRVELGVVLEPAERGNSVLRRAGRVKDVAAGREDLDRKSTRLN